MGKVRRGGFVFVTWKGDHSPKHVHVCRDGRLVVKWDLDYRRPIKGTAPRRALEIIEALQSEGAL